MKNINLKYIKNENNIQIIASNKERQIAKYLFFHNKILSNISEELAKATLISWSTIDLCFAEQINIEIDCTQASQKYIKKHYNYVANTYGQRFKLSNATLCFLASVIEIASEPIVLDSQKYFLGYSLGKDSTLCKWLLNEAAIDNISLYKVSYDNDKHSDDGHIECQILDQFIYSQISVSGIKSNSDIISASQADDIHVTFIAPYCNLANGVPGNLIVGLPWDVIHSFDNGLGELVPTETYKSIKMLEELFLSLNILGFKVLSPIASLHTYAVYNVLQKIIGIDQLMQLESCWDAYLFHGHACGACPKCQRLKFIFKQCFKIEYIPWAPTLNISSADFLFSSIYALHAANRYPDIDFKSSCIIDNESKAFSGQFIDLLCTKFNLIFVKKDIIIPFIPDSQVWPDITKQIIDFIEIDYSKLNSCQLHSLDVPYLPFEGYYNWGRTTKVLSCYSYVSFYNSRFQQWELVQIAKNGPELIIPDLEIFRKWLDLDNIKRNYPNVYILYERKKLINSI